MQEVSVEKQAPSYSSTTTLEIKAGVISVFPESWGAFSVVALALAYVQSILCTAVLIQVGLSFGQLSPKDHM